MAAIKKATGIQADLIKGGSGTFDVRMDGELIFSKHNQGRFPEHEEILDQLG